MLDSHSDNKPELEAEYTEFESNRSGNQGSLLSREPSFSGWCDEDGKVHFEHPVGNSGASVEEHSDFELASLGWGRGRLENGAVGTEKHRRGKNFEDMGMRLDGGNAMEDCEVAAKEGGNGERYVPFDIEDASVREIRLMSYGVDGTQDFGKHEKLPPSSASPVSAADVLKTLFFILIWYFFSIFLTLYNKTLLGDHRGKFPAPLLMNTVHFSMQAFLSKGITWYWSHRFHPTVAMSWRDYFIRVVPTAIGTALDVDLSNVSLVFISVTFATMCKSASPIFLLLFAFAFRLESPSIKLSGIIVIISVGVLLTVAKETEFQFWGFVFVMLAAVMSGFRWAMTQILLQKEAYGLKNPLTLMSYVTPIMAISTGLLSLVLDPWYQFKTSSYFDSSWHVVLSCLLMLFGGTLAFFMVLTEYVLISVTSAVTVIIAGVVKEAVTILVAVFYMHEEFTWMMGAGLFTIMIGVSLFNWYKYQKLQKGPTKDDTGCSPTSSDAAKYVILEEMDDQDDSP